MQVNRSFAQTTPMLRQSTMMIMNESSNQWLQEQESLLTSFYTIIKQTDIELEQKTVRSPSIKRLYWQKAPPGYRAIKRLKTSTQPLLWHSLAPMSLRNTRLIKTWIQLRWVVYQERHVKATFLTGHKRGQHIMKEVSQWLSSLLHQ